jgi:hypothetical protein
LGKHYDQPNSDCSKWKKKIATADELGACQIVSIPLVIEKMNIHIHEQNGNTKGIEYADDR